MLFLSFAGVGHDLAVALIEGDAQSEPQVLSEERLDFAGMTSERQGTVSSLIPTIDKLFKEAGRSKSQLQALIVGTGPGGFTAVRVLLVTARTLAQVMALPLIGINALEGSALQMAERDHGDSLAQAGGNLRLCIIKEASKTHCYAALYSIGRLGNRAGALLDLKVEPGDLEPSYWTLSETLAFLKELTERQDGSIGCTVYADAGALNKLRQVAAESYQSSQSSQSYESVRIIDDPLHPVKNMAVTQAKLGILRLSLSKESFLDYMKVEPLYLRGASVTLKKDGVVQRVESH
ncbi:MAG: tRNA (adenosine(37)-N6)-threonylcarbamoyltransferase complex dimerization subunit type 1 TsaB [Burkholderiaceae bacterium]|nr:MAG: tRNA threonylcarbamoyladenosine biosynthesis protein TsaB [bacterium ADurb.Bin425]TXI96961.1 MAG: tRNA (adenosine(37)-N6)-threonylcarbamoyltransferase complex dimerization subunit type 1 TsaB [Burkholderiaceae bacterium]